MPTEKATSLRAWAMPAAPRRAAAAAKPTVRLKILMNAMNISLGTEGSVHRMRARCSSNARGCFPDGAAR
jgi:hypothetical protein